MSKKITLSHDEFGVPIYVIDISFARRRTNTEIENPFKDPDERTWWSDAHDPAQQSYYLSESRAQFIHLKESLKDWRLGLPYLQRGNALVLPKKPASGARPRRHFL